MILGICGWAGAGKDTIADYLVNFHEFRRTSFAASLKDAISSIFGWDRELLEGRSKKARAWRETVDPWWSERLGIPNLTPRWILQHWGTEVCRIGFHNEIWIASVENKLRHTSDNIVISDCRFPNEIESIKKAGGRIIWIQRGNMPEWYQTAIIANSGDIVAQHVLEDLKIHRSETAWVGSEFDIIIPNNSTIDDLYSKVKSLLVI